MVWLFFKSEQDWTRYRLKTASAHGRLELMRSSLIHRSSFVFLFHKVTLTFDDLDSLPGYRRRMYKIRYL